MRRQVGQFLREQLNVKVRKSGGKRPLWKLLPALEHARATLDPTAAFLPGPNFVVICAARRPGKQKS